MTFIISCVLYSLLWLITWLPLRVLYLFSDALFVSIYYLFPYRKKITRKNLKSVFPDKKSKEIKSIERKFYKQFIDSLIESIYLMHMSPKELSDRYRYKNISLLEEIYSQGKNIILLLPHYGNWDWLAGLERKTSYHFLAVYKPLSNQRFDKLFINIRERFGGETVPMKQALRKMIDVRKTNKLIISFFLYDQRPLANELNYWISFLNHDTPVLLGAEKIAKKLHQPVVFLKTRRIRRGYYESEFIELFRDPAATKDHEITDKYYSILEEMIKEVPESWLWSHNRWKFSRPE